MLRRFAGALPYPAGVLPDWLLQQLRGDLSCMLRLRPLAKDCCLRPLTEELLHLAARPLITSFSHAKASAEDSRGSCAPTSSLRTSAMTSTTAQSSPLAIGVGFDTARYGHHVTFLRPDLQAACPAFEFP